METQLPPKRPQPPIFCWALVHNVNGDRPKTAKKLLKTWYCASSHRINVRVMLWRFQDILGWIFRCINWKSAVFLFPFYITYWSWMIPHRLSYQSQNWSRLLTSRGASKKVSLYTLCFIQKRSSTFVIITLEKIVSFFKNNFCTARPIRRRNNFAHTWEICSPHLNNILTLPCLKWNITFHTFIMHC